MMKFHTWWLSMAGLLHWVPTLPGYSTVPENTLALINGLEAGEQVQAGRSYKVVTGGP